MPETDPTRRTEWSLLRVACSAIAGDQKLAAMRSLLRDPVCWLDLFDLAGRHGVQPLLYQALSKIPESVPPEHLQVLEQKYQINLHKTLFLSRELIAIVTRLSELGIEVMTYKGVSLAESLYGDMALRQSGDMDLFVHAADVPRIREAVRERGYVPHLELSQAEEHAYLRTGYECSFDNPLGRNLLEVQWAIQPRFYAVEFGMEGLFRRGILTSVAGQPMKTPSAEDLFMILSLHASKHVWGRLIWLCDLARLMGLPSLNWEWISSQAVKLRILRILQVGMLLTNRVLSAYIPAAAEGNLPPDPHSLKLVDEIEPLIAGGEPYNSESLEYFRLMLRLREHKADRLRFLSRLAFTPGPGEWKAVPLPQSLFPLYRLVRFSRLTARLVRS